MEVKPLCPYIHSKHELHPASFMLFCQSHLGVAPARVRRDIDAWIEEDTGHGDITMTSAFPSKLLAQMYIVAKDDFVLAGLPIMAEIFRSLSGDLVHLYSNFSDGSHVTKGSVILSAEGPATGLVLGERIALNLGSRLSGIATKTSKTLELLETHRPKGAKLVLLETRKTTPGLRIYEKYATRTAGARNHRHGLDAGAMLKENHLRSWGSIPIAMQKVKDSLPVLSKLEVEVTTLAEFIIAMENGADVIMLDNFSQSDVLIAVSLRNEKFPGIKLELSGNLDRADFAWLASSGVDYASMGALIHQAVSVDMSLQLFLHDK